MIPKHYRRLTNGSGKVQQVKKRQADRIWRGSTGAILGQGFDRAGIKYPAEHTRANIKSGIMPHVSEYRH
jgi:hypothetical protein